MYTSINVLCKEENFSLHLSRETGVKKYLLRSQKQPMNRVLFRTHFWVDKEAGGIIFQYG